MAYHYRDPGFTPIEVGKVYASSLHFYTFKCKLKRHNQATGVCFLTYANGVKYISETDLSHWHRVADGPQL